MSFIALAESKMMLISVTSRQQETSGIEKTFRAGYFLAPMASFGKNLKRIRIDRGMQAKELAEKVGATAPMVSRWERKGVMPEAATVARIAEVLGVEIRDLLPSSDQPGHTGTGQQAGREVDDYDRDISRGYKKHDVPVVGDAEASSKGVIAWNDDGLVSVQVEDWVSRSFADGDPKAYALRIRGDSMVPRYSPGDVVIAQPRLVVHDGSYACVQLQSGERLIKRVFRDGTSWILRSLNPEYPDRTVASGDVAAIHRIKHAIEP